jgi:hypothetical protein
LKAVEAKSKGAEMPGAIYDKSDIEVVDLPLRSPGACGAESETVQVRNLPSHILTRVQRALENEKDGGPSRATEVLAHFAGALQGAQLVDKPTSHALDKIVAEFARTQKSDQEKYFKEKVRPFIGSLRTSRRA